MPAAHIIRGNALALPLPDSSVDLVVTSPPYWSLRAYQDAGEAYAGQIGSEETAAEFIDNLVAATAEMKRVLKPTGSIFVNLGDKYGPNKSLMLLPERYRIACVERLGLIARATIVWAKPNGLPESVTDRVRRSHEDWVHLTKEPRYFSAVDEIREEHKPGDSGWGKQAQRGEQFRQMHSDPGSGHSTTSKDGLGAQTMGRNPLGKLPGSVWTIPTQPLRVPPELGIDHFAAFPMEWPRRIIQGWSPSGVCSACGEGQRPVKATELTADRGGRKNQGAADAARGGTQDFAATTLGRDRIITITGYACACPIPECSCAMTEMGLAYCQVHGYEALEPAPTIPAVVLDPFGGTGTTALMAKALGRTGISVDMSADYCRLAEWRTNDPGQMAAALQVEKPDVVHPDQMDLFADL